MGWLSKYQVNSSEKARIKDPYKYDYQSFPGQLTYSTILKYIFFWNAVDASMEEIKEIGLKK